MYERIILLAVFRRVIIIHLSPPTQKSLYFCDYCRDCYQEPLGRPEESCYTPQQSSRDRHSGTTWIPQGLSENSKESHEGAVLIPAVDRGWASLPQGDLQLDPIRKATPPVKGAKNRDGDKGREEATEEPLYKAPLGQRTRSVERLCFLEMTGIPQQYGYNRV